jgi:hypothetical protein
MNIGAWWFTISSDSGQLGGPATAGMMVLPWFAQKTSVILLASFIVSGRFQQTQSALGQMLRHRSPGSYEASV